MTRIDRRIRMVGSHKKPTPWDPRQTWLEGAQRNRVGRKIRALLRRMEPVVLVTPRWSQAQRFLDDVATDLAVGRPAIACRTLSLAPLQARTLTESWTWLVRALIEFLGLTDDGPPSACVDRQGFRKMLSDLFVRSQGHPKSALLLHGCEHLHLEAREDLLDVVAEHLEEGGPKRALNMLFAGSIDSDDFHLPERPVLWLADYGRAEAIEALAEYTGPVEPARLSAIVQVVGGVPALIDKLGYDAEARGALTLDKDAMWRTLGPLAEEIRGAMSIVNASDVLAERLEQVAAGKASPDARDASLLRAGLVIPGRHGITLRAPLFADLTIAR
jgi:hypothetical protein